MSTLDTSQALASNTTTIYTGSGLKFRVDQSSSTLQLIAVDGSYVDVWGKSLQYAFGLQQLSVTLTFTPINGSSPVTASYVNSQGTTVVSTPQSGSAVLTVQRPANTGVSFNIDLEQDTQSYAAAVASPPAAPPPTSTTSSTLRTGALAGSRVAATDGTSSAAGTMITPSARLQTKLVLTTVEPPPDPDVRPRTETAFE